MLSPRSMVAYFSQRFEYQLHLIDPLVLRQSINVLEFRFGSYRCQAQWACRNIMDHPDLPSRSLRAKFERDPCNWEGPARLGGLGAGHGVVGMGSPWAP